ncbi:MAG: methyltransferase domain-containing protein [Deltaproteobacteria bacterium]|nr:methyltransferase domain-containing protein [Deltaproteobacteria bacterium]
MSDLPSKRKTRNLFAGVAGRYRVSADHTDAEDRRILISRLAFAPSHIVLDVATGGGHTAVTIAPVVRRMIASDLTPEMLREARILAAERGCGNMDFMSADAELLPFRSESFDRVVCRIAPHHFPDVREALSEIVRVTKTGGKVGIIDSVVPEDPALDAFMNGIEKVRDPSHVHSYRVEEWVSFLKEAGLYLLHVSCAWKEHPFEEWVSRTGMPEAVQREVEEMFLNAFPRARDFFRVRIKDGRVVSYSDEKGIFVGRKE